MRHWLILGHLQRRALKWEPKSTKWCQNGTKTFVADPPKCVLGKSLVLLCILVGIWVTGGTLLAPIGQLLIHFWCHFWEHVLRCLGTIRARRIEHVILQNYFGVVFLLILILCCKCSFLESLQTKIGALVALQIGQVASKCCCFALSFSLHFRMVAFGDPHSLVLKFFRNDFHGSEYIFG